MVVAGAPGARPAAYCPATWALVVDEATPSAPSRGAAGSGQLDLEAEPPRRVQELVRRGDPRLDTDDRLGLAGADGADGHRAVAGVSPQERLEVLRLVRRQHVGIDAESDRRRLLAAHGREELDVDRGDLRARVLLVA